MGKKSENLVLRKSSLFSTRNEGPKNIWLHPWPCTGIQWSIFLFQVPLPYLGSGHSHDDPESSGSSSQELAEAMPEEAETRS